MKLPILSLMLALAFAGAPGPASALQADPRPPKQIADSTAIAAIARDITAEAVSDSARAAAIYEWVARNVAWDVEGYLSGSAATESAEDVFRRRIALCGGYVALYARLAREAGLTVQPIAGYAKGFDYVEGQSTKVNNHAWLAVSLDGQWRLVDPTWGAGHVFERRFVPDFNWDYFLVSADELIISHFPEKAQWQLTAQPLRRRDFERMPAVSRRLFDVGFAPAAVRSRALAAGPRDFPTVGLLEHVRVLAAPIAGTLPSNAVVELDVIWPGATDVALVSGETWTHLSRNGDRFQGAAAAGAVAVYVVGRTGPAETDYTTLLHYRVAQ